MPSIFITKAKTQGLNAKRWCFEHNGGNGFCRFTVWSRFCTIGVGINNFKARFQQFLDEVLIGILIILDLLFGY